MGSPREHIRNPRHRDGSRGRVHGGSRRVTRFRGQLRHAWGVDPRPRHTGRGVYPIIDDADPYGAGCSGPAARFQVRKTQSVFQPRGFCPGHYKTKLTVNSRSNPLGRTELWRRRCGHGRSKAYTLLVPAKYIRPRATMPVLYLLVAFISSLGPPPA